MTDFGIAERFRDRYGADFRFTTAKGWLGWDGRRWKVLDQDKDTPPAEVIAAAFETIRAIQREARRVADTGSSTEAVTIGKQQDLDLEDPDEHALDYWMAVGKQWKLFSTVLAGWGRQSEQSGKPAAIAALARRWLTVPIEEFDCEQMAINVINGTLRFTVEQLPEGVRKVAVSLSPHRSRGSDHQAGAGRIRPRRAGAAVRRDDRLGAAGPAVRRYVHQVGGYACSGDTGEHLLWFNYGRGRNGKSTCDRQLVLGARRLFGHDRHRELPRPGHQEARRRGDARSRQARRCAHAARLGARARGEAQLGADQGRDRRRADERARAAPRLLRPAAAVQAADERQFQAEHPRHRRRHLGPHEAGPVAAHIEKPQEDPYAVEFPCAEWPKRRTPSCSTRSRRPSCPACSRAWSRAWSIISSIASSSPSA
jgi:hypothetical protein